jgi:hypothetical protein
MSTTVYEETILPPTDPTGNYPNFGDTFTGFGLKIAYDGKFLVVGTPSFGHGGAVIYKKNESNNFDIDVKLIDGGRFNRQQYNDIDVDYPSNSSYGSRLGVYNNFVVIGGIDSFQIFKYDDVQQIWSQQGSTINGIFLDMKNDLIIYGIINGDNYDLNTLHKNVLDEWDEGFTITNNDVVNMPQNSSYFGYQAAIYDNKIIVGQPRMDAHSQDLAGFHEFTYIDKNTKEYNNTVTTNFFPGSIGYMNISYYNDSVILAIGNKYEIFVHNTTNGLWESKKSETIINASSLLTNTLKVSISNENAIIGTGYTDDNNIGAAYIIQKTNNNWGDLQQITTTGFLEPAGYNSFGLDVVINNSDLLISSTKLDSRAMYYFTIPISGCMNVNADNYNPSATVDDGTCEFLGCTNPIANNYDPSANVDDGSCEFLGCTNPIANNYDPSANVDDGSCELLGCMNENADNYDPSANVDDGSCEFSGCMNENASNYNPEASTDDGSCKGCTDPRATNYIENVISDNRYCNFLDELGQAPNFAGYDAESGTLSLVSLNS